MLDDIQKLTRNKMCINSSDDAILENYHKVLQHYIGLFDRINTINYDGPYIKLAQKDGGKKRKSTKKNKSIKKKKSAKKNKSAKKEEISKKEYFIKNY